MVTDRSALTILDLCGATGAWSKGYRDNGYDVKIITLPHYNLLFTQFFNDYMIFRQRKLYNRKQLFIHYSDVYGILAAPVCTMFSFARTRAKTPRDFRQGMKLVIACLQIIWECRYKTKLKFWALENPMGYLRQFLGKPVFTFDPCDFGDPYTKKTDLWGFFNLPKKNPVIPKCKNFIHYLPPGPDRQTRRSITPSGFARAFFEANK